MGDSCLEAKIVELRLHFIDYNFEEYMSLNYNATKYFLEKLGKKSKRIRMQNYQLSRQDFYKTVKGKVDAEYLIKNAKKNSIKKFGKEYWDELKTKDINDLSLDYLYELEVKYCGSAENALENFGNNMFENIIKKSSGIKGFIFAKILGTSVKYIRDSIVSAVSEAFSNSKIKNIMEDEYFLAEERLKNKKIK